MKGFVYPEPKGQNPGPRYAKINEKFCEGDVWYSLREGGHGMPQADWDTIAEFLLQA